ncbi:amino acid ABC transporter permease [Anaerotardibacter muris]|uniref:amino acid ABC transporter permease n=1 Tax=Anaerotardibacter muris TaxID=2941505 RepID=UPI00203E38B1|nr:amino acid ABC transporter permease [Anaerotardibacter muris]
MQQRISSAAAVLMAFVVACAVAFVGLTALPADAEALDTAKCTARPNADGSSEVKGATETRITWEGQAAEDESIKGITLTLPQGTSFTTKNARITMLSGEDLMQRTNIDASFSQEGDSIVATFDNAAPAGGYFRFEVYEVKFPATGGAMELTGTYELADGDYKEIGEIPAINVVSVDPAEELSSYLGKQEWVQAWNSNKFLHLFLDPTILVTSFPVVVKGFFMALGIVLVAFPCAIPFGLILALMRMSRLRVLRGIATTYVNVVRGTPLFLQIYIAFFGLPLAGMQVPPFPLGVVVLAMNSSAYLCEIFRAGIQSIPKGQFEASRSLGMNGAQTMLFVIIPQTVRRVIPTMTSEFILLYKDTSLLAAVGVMEVVMYAKTIVAATGSITPYIVAACFYLVITLPLAKIVGHLEDHLANKDAGGSKKKKRKKHKAPAPLDPELEGNLAVASESRFGENLRAAEKAIEAKAVSAADSLVEELHAEKEAASAALRGASSLATESGKAE